MRIVEQQSSRGKEGVFDRFVEVATVGLRDQDRLEGAFNFVIQKATMPFLLDEHGMKAYIDNVVPIPQDVDQLKEYRREMAKEKHVILDGIKDHIVSHTSGKNITKEMLDGLSTLY